MKSFLTLSLGSETGWARLDLSDNGDPQWSHGTWDCYGTPTSRLTALRYFVDRQLALKVDRVFVHSREGTMLAALNKACTEQGVSCHRVSISQVRSFADRRVRSSRRLPVDEGGTNVGF